MSADILEIVFNTLYNLYTIFLVHFSKLLLKVYNSIKSKDTKAPFQHTLVWSSLDTKITMKKDFLLNLPRIVFFNDFTFSALTCRHTPTL